MVASMFMTALATAAIPVGANAQQRGPAVSVGSNDLGGVVRSAEGPEAGVWVIAETTDTPRAGNIAQPLAFLLSWW